MILYKFFKYRQLFHFNKFCTKVKHDSLSKRLMLVIDTHNVVQEFKTSGFTEQQAEALKNFALNLLNTQADIMDEMNSHLFQRQEFEMHNDQLLTEVATIKKDLINASMEYFNKMEDENEKSKMEIQLLRQQLKEEIDKTSNGMTSAINIEQSRTRDDFNQIKSEIVKTQNRIDSQIANLRTSFEQYRNEVLKYAVGAVVVITVLSIGYYMY